MGRGPVGTTDELIMSLAVTPPAQAGRVGPPDGGRPVTVPAGTGPEPAYLLTQNLAAALRLLH